ncbi:MAG: AAA domain-containing protein, partial [Saprospiraceae bacterium]
ALLMERLFVEATKQEQLAFSTLFARISYTGHLYNMQPATLQLIHAFRFAAKRVRAGYLASPREVQLGTRAVAETVLVLAQAAIPPEVIELWADFELSEEQQRGELRFANAVRVVAVRDLAEENCLLALEEDNPAQTIRVRYGLPARNENFDPTIQVIRKVFGFPVTLNLLEVDIAADGDYQPRAIVVEPDYLMDVSAIAECFKDTGAEPYAYLVRKFLPHENTEPILLGNIANFFLDRLLNEPDVAWSSLFRETFQLYPFTYAPMTDAEVRGVSGKAQKHYLNLKSMAMPAGGFSKQGIEAENCVLEPTFFSERYGIQGRLDLFYRNGERAAIVELKSGTPFKPNSYGIQRSHFTQTLLYDLLVRSVFGQQTDPAKYILYSGADLNPLRFAPTIAPEQWEALQLRNQLVAIERLLCNIQPGDTSIPVLNKLRGIHGKGFLVRDFARFEGLYASLSFLEKKYFNAFVGFVAREHWLAKVGEENSDNLNGHAALWRGSFPDKQQGFCILSHLEIVENHANQPEPTILFRKTDQTNPLANFRVGDIAVLYPALEESDTVLDHQVIKCTIIELGKEFLTVQLRFRQFNLKPFDTEGLWQLEPDLMDTGYAGMYRSLLEWAGTSADKRSLLIALQPGRPPQPEAPASSPEKQPWENGLTTEQAALLQRIILSEDYFLLWGPPGTGKTSVMLRALAEWVLGATSDNLLLLAYTNRAVDEICAALDSLGGDIRQQYLRIGSRYVTGEPYRDQLLNANISEARTRADLKAILQSRRIFVSTVASFSQNDGLLKLKKFQRLVVDEASQILEPQLIGLLTRFQHFVLIGDHRQLPAITVQRPERSRVEDADLQSINLHDLRDSYFERLYRHCEQQGWHWAFGRLSHQGRMHSEVMDFANRHFYSDFLQTLPKEEAEVTTHYQHAALNYQLPGQLSAFERLLLTKRVVFLASAGEPGLPGQKTNRGEAEQVAQLVLFFKNLYAANDRAWQPSKTLGIITPWRAQIAQLRVSLMALGLDPDEITIDTVERYQGGARDIILLSTCVNSEWQLGSLVSLSAEGVDRKLNVALTRARQHVVMIGNAEILATDPRYRVFIEAYGHTT